MGTPRGARGPTRKGAAQVGEACPGPAREAGGARKTNSHPSPMARDEISARRAAALGIPLAIDSDAHDSEQLEMLEYGASVARRAWVAPTAVINTWPVEQLLTWLRRSR